MHYNDTFVFDCRTHEWRLLNLTTSDVPLARGGACFGAYYRNAPDKHLLVGGVGGGMQPGYYDDTWVLELSRGGIVDDEVLQRASAEVEARLQQKSDLPYGVVSSLDGCAYCGKTEGKLLKCARCVAVRYCNRDCQKAHWREHKPVCKAPSQ
eukprot:TRINITY_DN11731_c0_g1_i2.p3 TRINITY_DN11731_c0_g1~~TRINITY_DN11731_c0_g1_i2.p3  ORF type:complete len:152 (-),score=34.89 TRINITY_DN11731_c0_g1_i2:80-535(-)